MLIYSALLSVNSNVAGAGSSAVVAFFDSPNMAPALEGAHLLALPWLTVHGALLHTIALFSAYTHGIACNGAIASYAIICRLVDKVKIRHSAPSGVCYQEKQSRLRLSISPAKMADSSVSLQDWYLALCNRTTSTGSRKN